MEGRIINLCCKICAKDVVKIMNAIKEAKDKAYEEGFLKALEEVNSIDDFLKRANGGK